MIKIWVLAAVFSLIAGWIDFRSRRIPNWLTVPGLGVGIAANSVIWGWSGCKTALFGAGFGLLLLLPFVAIRGLGAGDWKLIGALGAFVGPHRLLLVLLGTILVNGLIAVFVIIWKKRIGRTLRNMAAMGSSLLTFHMPGPEVSLDYPDSLKIPFGVGVAVTVTACALSVVWRPL
jgi:prepilin peptidase CpaA